MASLKTMTVRFQGQLTDRLSTPIPITGPIDTSRASKQDINWDISRSESGCFQDCWKFPDVRPDISRIVGNFQWSVRIFPVLLEISRGQSGYIPKLDQSNIELSTYLVVPGLSIGIVLFGKVKIICGDLLWSPDIIFYLSFFHLIVFGRDVHSNQTVKINDYYFLSELSQLPGRY